MLNRVTPIYDNARVVLWIFEALGLEWQAMWDAIEELPEQLFPDTATWSISLWERRYGITPDAGDSIDVRRSRVLGRRYQSQGFNPAALEQYVKNALTNVTCSVIEDASLPYTFIVEIASTGTITGSMTDVVSYIKRNKPSHLSFEMKFKTAETLTFRSSGTAVFDYGQLCGDLIAGADNEL